MAFVEFRSLNSKADHLVNWGLVSSIHEDMDASQVLYQNHLESALRFQNCSGQYLSKKEIGTPITPS